MPKKLLGWRDRRGSVTRTLKRMQRVASRVEVTDIQSVLDSERMQNDLYSRLDKKIGQPGKDRPILKFLWENREAILKFVLLIVSLFAKKGVRK